MKKFLTVFTSLVAFMLFSACNPPAVGENPAGNLTGSISGKAVYSNSSDNSGIIVSIEKTNGAKTASVEKTVSDGAKAIEKAVLSYVTTDVNGEYSFAGLDEGTYTVYASSNNSSEKAVFTNVVVTAGKSVTVEELKLTATGTITGNITIDKKATGNTGFLVFVAGTSFMALTDDAGNYTISSVPANGDYTIVVSKGDIMFTLSGNVTVTSSGKTTMPEAYLNSAEKSAYGKKDDLWVKLTADVPVSGVQGVPCASTLYVSQTGNDETGDGTRAKPYKTINKAYEVIEKTLDPETTYRIKLLSDLEKHVCVRVEPSFDVKVVIESDGINTFTVKGWGNDGIRYNENYKYSKFYIVDGVLQDDYDEADEARDKALGKNVYTNEIMFMRKRGNVLVRNVNFSEFFYGFKLGWDSDCAGTITLENVEMTKMVDTYFSGYTGKFVFNDVRLPQLETTAGWFQGKIDIEINQFTYAKGAWNCLVFADERNGNKPWSGLLTVKDGTFGDGTTNCNVFNLYGPVSDENTTPQGKIVIDGGVFNNDILSHSTRTRIIINDGTFNGSVFTYSSTLITGGKFNAGVSLNDNMYPFAIHKITGGTFKDYSSIGAYFDWSDLTDLSVIRGKKFISPEAYNQTSDYDMYYAVKISDDASGYNGSYSGTLYDYSRKTGIATDWESIKAAKMADSTTDLEFDDANYKMISWPKSETAPDYVRSMGCKISEDKGTILFCVDGNYYSGVLVQ